MEPGFSEFGYGYAVVRELEQAFGRGLRAPRFPTQADEGAVGGGYDVNLDDLVLPLFLQFKRSEEMLRSNAAEADEFGTPYFRFKLRTGRDASGINQHNLLVALAEQHPERVAYIAPRFASYQDFDDAYIGGTVADRSLTVQPEHVGRLQDRSRHAIVFTWDPGDGWVRRSDPVQGESIGLFGFVDNALSEPMTLGALLQTREALAGIKQAGQLIPRDRLPSPDGEPATALARLTVWLSSMLDVQLYLFED